MKKVCIFVCFVVILFSGCTKKNSLVDDDVVLILRYADNQPEDFPTTKAARYFAALVRDRTDGKINIEVYGNGELGNELDVYQQIQFGGVDFSRLSLGTLSDVVPFMSVLQLPYLYEDGNHMWKVLDSEIGDMFLSKMSETGMIGLCWFDAGARSFYTTSEVSTLEDLQGKVIRVQETKLMSQIIEYLGVKTLQIPYNLVYSALQMKEIDGAENNPPSYVSKGHNAIAPYFLLDEHFRVPEIVVMSPFAREKIAKIDEKYIQIIIDCGKECARYERELWEKAEKEAFIELEKTGCKITYLSEAEKEKFRKAMDPVYHIYNEEYGDIIQKIITYK